MSHWRLVICCWCWWAKGPFGPPCSNSILWILMLSIKLILFSLIAMYRHTEKAMSKFVVSYTMYWPMLR